MQFSDEKYITDYVVLVVQKIHNFHKQSSDSSGHFYSEKPHMLTYKKYVKIFWKKNNLKKYLKDFYVLNQKNNLVIVG